MGYIIDTETKNTSFKMMSEELEKAGVKNHSFCLRLDDIGLMYVEPHNLEEDDYITQEKVIFECKNNIWYFLREVARVVDYKSIGNAVPVQMNPATLAKVYCSRGNINTYTTTPRQTFKTTHSLLVILYDILFSEGDYNHALTNIDDLDKITRLFNLLPGYITKNIDLTKHVYHLLPKKIHNGVVPHGSLVISDVEHSNFTQTAYEIIAKHESIETNYRQSHNLTTPIYVLFDSTVGDNDIVLKHTERWDVSYFDISQHYLKRTLFKDKDSLIFYIECNASSMGFDVRWMTDSAAALNSGKDIERTQKLIDRELKLIRDKDTRNNPLGVETDYSKVIMDRHDTVIGEYGQIEDIIKGIGEINRKLDMVCKILKI